MEARERMKRLTRRRFVAIASMGVASSALTACGGDKSTSTDLTPTKITTVENLPTLAAFATPPDTSGAAAQPSGGGGAPTSVDLDMVDLKFQPADFTIAANTDVTINLTNSGALTHDFHMDEPKPFTSDVLTGGQKTSFKLNLAPGTYDYWCSQPGHKQAGMVGKITVSAGGSGGGASTSASPAAAAATAVTLDTVDLKFQPADFTIAANTDVKVTMTNKGALPHDFTIDKPSVKSDAINGGQTTTFTLNLPPGTYDFYCSEPGHKAAGMVGKVTVVAPGSGGGGAAPASPAAGAPQSGGGGAPSSVDLDMVDLKFKPADFTIAANTDVTINLTNSGALTHDFHMDAPKAFTSDALTGGQKTTFKLNLPPGTYDYWCSQPGHKQAGMVGKITAK
jgi:plastocyanin